MYSIHDKVRVHVVGEAKEKGSKIAKDADGFVFIVRNCIAKDDAQVYVVVTGLSKSGRCAFAKQTSMV